MAAIAKSVGVQAGRSAAAVSALAGRFGVVLRRAAAVRYAERRAHVERTGLAGMI